MPSALHLLHLLVTTTLLLLRFIIPSLPMKELEFWATSQGHKLVKWLDWDATPGPLHWKLRHLSVTQTCFAASPTPNENTALRILQIPTMFEGLGRWNTQRRAK